MWERIDREVNGHSIMGCTCPRTVCWTQHGANVKTQDDRERKQKTHLAHWVLNLSAKKQKHFPSFHHEKRDCHGFAFCSHQMSRLVTVSADVLCNMPRMGLQFRAVTTNCVSSLRQERDLLFSVLQLKTS